MDSKSHTVSLSLFRGFQQDSVSLKSILSFFHLIYKLILNLNFRHSYRVFREKNWYRWGWMAEPTCIYLEFAPSQYNQNKNLRHQEILKIFATETPCVVLKGVHKTSIDWWQSFSGWHLLSILEPKLLEPQRGLDPSGTAASSKSCALSAYHTLSPVAIFLLSILVWISVYSFSHHLDVNRTDHSRARCTAFLKPSYILRLTSFLHLTKRPWSQGRGAREWKCSPDTLMKSSAHK